MKKLEKAKVFLGVFLIGLLAFFAVGGLYIQHGDILQTYVRGLGDLKLGQDLTGGMEVTFRPAEPATDIELRSTQEVLDRRLDYLGIQDYQLYISQTDPSISVSFPRQSDADLQNYETIIDALTERAVLTLRDGIATDETGRPTGEILLEARDISSVQAEGDTSTGRVQIALALTEDGQNKFDSAAARLAGTGRNISIWLDNQLLSVIYTRSGSVAPVITGESGVGEFTAESAGALADKLNAGALPLSLAAEDFSFTSALMGTDTLDTLTAGIRWGFLLLTLLMLVLYRLPGAVVSVALAGQLALILAAYTGFLPFAQPTTLTASGLFGILLVMGFGVNTGVSIAERIKRELRSGKNLDYSIGAGYKQACSTLFEGRGPIFLAALLLLGSLAIAESAPSQLLSELLGGFHAAAADSVYSFLFAILAGVVSNYIMGVWVSRLMLRSLSKYGALRDPVLYGGNKE
ncbi:MAG: hypothetical protein KH009_10020 [Clostridiales bacterium]|nr:hypothetical protein [Clostridiales bacterium]